MKKKLSKIILVAFTLTLLFFSIGQYWSFQLVLRQGSTMMEAFSEGVKANFESILTRMSNQTVSAMANRYGNYLDTYLQNVEDDINVLVTMIPHIQSPGIEPLLQSLMDHKKDNNVFSVYFENGQYYNSDGFVPDATYNPQERDWYELAVQAKGRAVWTQPYKQTYTNDDVLACSRAFYKDGKVQGVCVVNVNLSQPQAFLKENYSEDAVHFLVDENGTLLTNVVSQGAGKMPKSVALGEAHTGTASFSSGDVTYAYSYIRSAFAPVYVVSAMTDAAMQEYTNNVQVQMSQQLTDFRTSFLRIFAIVMMLTLLISAVIFALEILIIGRSNNKIIQPLEQMTQAVQDIGGGNFDLRLDIHTGDEIETLANTFNDMSQNLKEHIVQLEIETEKRAKMDKELGMAYEIQQGLLPKEFPQCVELAAMMEPAKKVGGDFYDFVQKEDKLYFAVGDVSDKGIPAALFMASLKTLFHTFCDGVTLPSEILEKMNDSSFGLNPQTMFATIFVGMFDLSQQKLSYASAGHCPPFVQIDGRFEELVIEGALPLSIIEGVQYACEELEFGESACIFVYSDGVSEAMDTQRVLFGTQKIGDVLNESNAYNGTQILEHMLQAVCIHEQGGAHTDDITMLLLRGKQRE